MDSTSPDRARRIAVIPGDGVGPEITRVAVSIAEAAAGTEGKELRPDWFDWGCGYYERHGEMMPPDALEVLAPYDAIYLGCIGDSSRVPDYISLQLLLRIRKGFDQYINLRPVFLYQGVPSPLREAVPGQIDLVVVRENVEGEYAQVGGRLKRGTADEVAIQTSVFTRKGTERTMRYAFELSRARRKLAADGGAVGMVTNCSKSNALNYSMVFWDEVYNLVAADYPDIRRDFALVDALSMWMIKNPSHFDVIVASNLFGDIITDLGAMLQGGMGFAAGANINPERTFPSMFEPIHGSAPKYAGKSVVNPVAAVEAARMMLEYLGLNAAAGLVRAAVRDVLAAGEVRTRDFGGSSRTDEMGQAILKRVQAPRKGGGPR
jgi:tartrate dehydrogenase/decarboxylase/D-malate dehydrogenase